MPERAAQWVCCQLGAREHYAVARALHSRSRLVGLITDAWVPPGNAVGLLKRSLRERFHTGLQDAEVRSANCSLLHFEFIARLRGLRGWDLTIARNRWFQQCAVANLASLRRDPVVRDLSASGPLTVFAYSYAALGIFRWAKAQGWRTVLGQIDPGPEMGRIIAELDTPCGETNQRSVPPTSYWQSWREECFSADRIVTNSRWSRECLVHQGIPAAKIAVIPLAYEPPAAAQNFHRVAPERFSKERPLRLLFLGQVTYLKGIIPLLEAMDQLRDLPVELTVVGSKFCAIPERLCKLSNIQWIGPVARGATAKSYMWADAFVFPSFCDGFGLTQLEAQAWQLPVIASRHCGEVVIDGVNGMRLAEVTGSAIAEALRRLIANPGVLREYAAHSAVGRSFSLSAIADLLLREP